MVMALTKAAHEGIYLTNMLKWLNKNLSFKLQNDFATILGDNKGSVDLSDNPTHHERTKHIDISHQVHKAQFH